MSLNQLLGLPGKALSKEGQLIDNALEAVHWFMLVIFVGWTIFFAITLILFYHKRNKKASYYGITSKAPKHLEIAVVIVEAVLLLGFAFPLWAERTEGFPEDADYVRAVGYQFGWVFHYPGEDKRFGRIDPKLKKTSNDIGLDMSDPAAWDDFTTPTLKCAVDQPVVVYATSNDVIHNLAIVKLRVAQDATPGEDVPTWFTPTEIGEYEIICAQLCGSGHGNMIGIVEVMSQDDFYKMATENSTKARQTYLDKQLIEKRKKLAPDFIARPN